MFKNAKHINTLSEKMFKRKQGVKRSNLGRKKEI